MPPTFRPYQTEDDYWRIRSFLREVFLFNGRREHSWHVARLDYWRWHLVVNRGFRDLVPGAPNSAVTGSEHGGWAKGCG